MAELYSCLGALALELTPGTRTTTTLLEQPAAGELSALIARDLSKLVPMAAQLDLALLAALFDPVELLRPTWPLHGELERLIAQAPGLAGSRVIAFAASHGQLPTHLQPNPDFAEGALRLLPLVLRGEASIARDVAGRFEHSLLDFGMAGADCPIAGASDEPDPIGGCPGGMVSDGALRLPIRMPLRTPAAYAPTPMMTARATAS